MTRTQEAALCDWLEERFCRSAGAIRAHIAAEFGLHYSHSGCIKLLCSATIKVRLRIDRRAARRRPLTQVSCAITQAPIARLMPTGRGDEVSLGYWCHRREWEDADDPGGIVMPLDDALASIANEGIFWIWT